MCSKWFPESQKDHVWCNAKIIFTRKKGSDEARESNILSTNTRLLIDICLASKYTTTWAWEKKNSLCYLKRTSVLSEWGNKRRQVKKNQAIATAFVYIRHSDLRLALQTTTNDTFSDFDTLNDLYTFFY